MNKIVNKKHALIPAFIVLMATMLMTPMVQAITTTWMTSPVYNSSNVFQPSYIVGSSGDDQYATFYSTSAQLVGKFSVTPPTGAVISVNGFATGATVRVDVYTGSSSTGPWYYAGYVNVPVGSDTWWTANDDSQGNYQYVGYSTSSGSGTLYIDYARAQY